jgi:hypothetical protein
MPVLLKMREIHHPARVTTIDYDTSPSSTNTARMHRMVDPGVHYAVGLFVDGLVMRKQRTQYGKSRMIRLFSSTKEFKAGFCFCTSWKSSLVYLCTIHMYSIGIATFLLTNAIRHFV